MIEQMIEMFGVGINEICQGEGRDYTFVLMIQDNDPNNQDNNCRSVSNLDLEDEISLVESFLEYRKGQR